MPEKSKPAEVKRSKRADMVEIPQLLRDIVSKNREIPMALVRNMVVYEANEALARLLGARSAADLRGMDASSMLGSGSRNVAAKRFEQRARGKMPHDAQVYEVTTFDGRKISIEISAISWPTDPSMTLSIARDITEHEQGLEELRNSERLYRTLAETLPAAVTLRDQSNRVIYVNDKAVEITGYSKNELMDGTVAKNVEEENDGLLIDVVAKGVASGPREMLLRRKDGSEMWISAECQPIQDAEGSYQGMCVAFVDITERKQHEKDLLLFRQAFEQAADGIVLADMDEHVIMLNDAWARMHGRSADELIGKHLKIFHTDEQWREEIVPLNDALVAEGAYQGEVGHVRADGTVFTARMSSSLLNDGNGNVIGAITVARDITERKQSELAIRQAHEDLARAYELQREFLNNMTHDVRTPLTAVVGYASIMIEGTAGPLNDEQQSLLRKMLASAETLLQTVDGALTAAKMNKGILELQVKSNQPIKIVSQTIDAILPQAMQKGITLEFEGPHARYSAYCDAEKLRAIVSNLITNAVKFTNSGGVKVMASPEGTGVEIIIIDSGIGMPADALSEVFDEFRQLDSPRRSKGVGFGLGLAIVARMVDMIGATLIVSTEEGIGTAFTLHAPSLEEKRREDANADKP